MEREELDNAVLGNKVNKNALKATEIANIQTFVDVSIKIDMDSLDYYYSIDVNDLLNSKMPSDELDTIKQQGWAYDESREHIILYLNV